MTTTTTTTSNAVVATPANAVAPISTAVVTAVAHTAGSYVGKGAAYVKHAVVSACINSGVAATTFGSGVKSGYASKDSELAERRARAREAVAAARAAGQI